MCTAVTQQTLNRANTKHGALHLAGSGGVKSTDCTCIALTQQTLYMYCSNTANAAHGALTVHVLH